MVYVCGLKMNYSDGLGACNRDRTGDLVLTKDVLYQLSYAGLRPLREIGDSQRRLICIPLLRQSEGVKARVEPTFCSSGRFRFELHDPRFSEKWSAKLAEAIFVSKDFPG